MITNLTLITRPALLAVLASQLHLSTLCAQDAAFAYQGRLTAGGSQATGSYEMRFTLYDTAVAGNVVGEPCTNAATAVRDGLFTANLNFGAGVFDGSARWLEIGLRTNGNSGDYAVLSPRQPVTATPYAVRAAHFSGAVTAAQLPATVAQLDLAGQTFTGTLTAEAFNGDGAGLTALNATHLSSGTVPDGRLALNVARTNQVWLLGGNSGTTPGTDFLGTIDNKALEFQVNGQRALRLEPNATGAPNLIRGAPENVVGAGATAATIGGGSGDTIQGGASHATISGGSGNLIQSNALSAVIGGGYQNLIGSNAWNATISGGYVNLIQPGPYHPTIGGGWQNRIESGASAATIAGGDRNQIQFNMGGSTIAGGTQNVIGTNSGSSAVSGGNVNIIQPNAGSSTIAGGSNNTIQSNASSAVISGGTGQTIKTGAANSTIGGGSSDMIQEGASHATISGGSGNLIQGSALSAVIGGGYQNLIGSNAWNATISGGYVNLIQPGPYHPTIGGGWRNRIESGASAATIAGGDRNQVQFDSYGSTIAGGIQNVIGTNSGVSTVSGGYLNLIQPNAGSSTIAGGAQNQIQFNAAGSTVSGGTQNLVPTNAAYATIPGGTLNSAASYAFAAGNRAKAVHTGAFVWADSQDADFSSSATNQFLVRASGGVGVNVNDPRSTLHVGGTARVEGNNHWNVTGTEGDFRVGSDAYRFKVAVAQDGGGAGDVWMRAHGGTSRLFLHTPGGTTIFSDEPQSAGVSLPAGGGAWTTLSDRNAKENFAAVNPREVLDKVAALPLATWNYKSQNPAIRHLGPTAQDFKAAFALGETETGITSVDADGVALAAIQGLNEKLEQTRAENRQLQHELAELKRLLNELSLMARPEYLEGNGAATLSVGVWP